MRQKLLLVSMIAVPLVAYADSGLPREYVAVMANMHGNLVARATECGFARDRAADVRRIAILAAISGNLPLDEVLKNTRFMATIGNTVRRNALFAKTNCSMVQAVYDGFELAPSTVSEQLISSSSTGSNAFEQLEAALLGFASSEQVASAPEQ